MQQSKKTYKCTKCRKEYSVIVELDGMEASWWWTTIHCPYGSCFGCGQEVKAEIGPSTNEEFNRIIKAGQKNQEAKRKLREFLNGVWDRVKTDPDLRLTHGLPGYTEPKLRSKVDVGAALADAMSSYGLGFKIKKDLEI